MRKAMNIYLDDCVPLVEGLIDSHQDEMVRLALMEARRYSKNRQVWTKQMYTNLEFLFSSV
jgi:hypothetical protein